MNYYVELQKNTQTTNCVKQIKKFNNFEEANNYFKNALLEFEPEDKGFIEFGELRIYYEFKEDLDRLETFKIEKEGLKNSNSFIENHLLLNPCNNFSVHVYKIRIPRTRIKF